MPYFSFAIVTILNAISLEPQCDFVPLKVTAFLLFYCCLELLFKPEDGLLLVLNMSLNKRIYIKENIIRAELKLKTTKTTNQ